MSKARDKIEAVRAKSSSNKVARSLLMGGMAISSITMSAQEADKYKTQSSPTIPTGLLAQLYLNGHYKEAYKMSFNAENQGIYDMQDREYLGETMFTELRETVQEEGESEDLFKLVEDYLVYKKHNDPNNTMLSSQYKDMKDYIGDLVKDGIISVVDTKDIETSALGEYTRNNGNISVTRINLEIDNDLLKERGYSEEKIATINEFVVMLKSDDYLNSVTAHEVTHKKNFDAGLHDYNYTKIDGIETADISIQDKDRLAQLDEISANVGMILALRETYKKDGDLSKKDSEMFSILKDYKDAIKNGKIDPNSSNPVEKEKEMQFIVDLAKNEWNDDRKNDDQYINQIYTMAEEYADFGYQRWISTDAGATISKESNNLVLRMKVQAAMTFPVDGKNINLSQHLNFEDIKSNENTDKLANYFYEKTPVVEKSSNKTFDARNMFYNSKQNQGQ